MEVHSWHPPPVSIVCKTKWVGYMCAFFQGSCSPKVSISGHQSWTQRKVLPWMMTPTLVIQLLLVILVVGVWWQLGCLEVQAFLARCSFQALSWTQWDLYEGHLESKERFAIKKYLLIIGKKKNMHLHLLLHSHLGHWDTCPVAYPGIFFRGGSTNSVEDRGQRWRGSGGCSPLVRGSGGSSNLVQEISFRIVKFS